MHQANRVLLLCLATLAFTGSPDALAQDVSFQELAGTGIGVEGYVHTPAARYQGWVDRLADTATNPMFPQQEFPDLAAQAWGFPGVVLIDYDNDDDLDIFVSNGPNTPNSLFQNQHAQTGTLSFVDVAASAGVDSPEMDTAGACYADIDNDGDDDLVTVGYEAPHRVFENNGDGTFDDITASAGLSDGGLGAVSCSFGDVNADGLVDLYIAHSWDQNSLGDCFAPNSDLDQPNEFYLNGGSNSFVDVSDPSGINILGGLPPQLEGTYGYTWAVTLLDLDLDGDIDIVNGDDQCGLPPAIGGGLDRGFIQTWDNDGTGSFTNTTVENRLDEHPGAWMGLSFADYNRDGYMDVFGSNFSGYFQPAVNQLPYIPDYGVSQSYHGGPNGFTNPGVGDLVTTPFGWGVTSQDWDNDGDTDIGFYGTLHAIIMKESTNPGTILINDGTGTWDWASDALETDHRNRGVHGVAGGDLDGDGRVDLVTAAAFNTADVPFTPFAAIGLQLGSAFDAIAGAHFLAFPVGDGSFIWTGQLFEGGGVSVERNTTENNNHWIKVETVGTVGITEDGVVNRNGIGATIQVTPWEGETAMVPVTAGSSHLSQDAHERHFGLGSSWGATVDVLWPGGVRNRLDHVWSGSRVTFPEIPCSYDTPENFGRYMQCVNTSLRDLKKEGVINNSERLTLRRSAMRAYWSAH